jgi:hypothetical protein
MKSEPALAYTMIKSSWPLKFIMGPNLQRRPYDVGKIVEENLS